MAPFTSVTASLSKDLAVVNRYMKNNASKFPEDATPDLSKIAKNATTVRKAVDNIIENIQKLHKDLGRGDLKALDKSKTAKDCTKTPEGESSSDTEDSSDLESIDEEESVLAKFFPVVVDEDGDDCLIDRLGIMDMFPRDGTAVEYHALAAKLGIIDADYMLQILRLATVKWGILREPTTGWIAHNDLSLRFPTSLDDDEGKAADKAKPSPKLDPNASQVPSARLSSSGSSQKLSVLHSPCIVPSSSSSGGSTPSQASKSSIAAVPGAGFSLVLHGFYWNTLSPGRLVVILSHTHDLISIPLAQSAKHLRFINIIPAEASVEDKLLPRTGGTDNLEHLLLAANIMWSAPADVFLLRRVLGRLSDQQCKEVFTRMTAYLRIGDILLINDVALGGTESEEEGPSTRQGDKALAVEARYPPLRERTLQDWMRLLAAVDKRFYVASFAKAPEDEGMSLMTVAWTA